MIFIRGHVEVMYGEDGLGNDKKEEKERLSLP